MTNPKEITLGVLTALVSIGTFWSWYEAIPALTAGEFEAYINFGIPVLGFLLSACFFSLAALFIRESKVVYPAIIISISAPYLFTEASLFILSAMALSAALSALAVHKIRKEYDLSPGFSAAKFLKSGLPLYLTTASLVISAFYLTGITEKNAISTLLPKSALEFGLKTLSGPLGSVAGLPEIDPEATVNELLEKVVSEGLKTKGLELTKLPRSEILKLIGIQRNELADKFGIKVKGNEKVGDLLYGTVTGKAEDLLGPYKSYLPYASAIAFFLAFKTLTIPLYYAALLITLLLIKLMVLTKILRSEKVQMETERLIL